MIIYITGGTRSGKSKYAQKLAQELSERPTYIATARRWDEDFKERIKLHEESRGKQWELIEEEKDIASLDFGDGIAVVDCITLWLTNYFVDFKQDIGRCLSTFKNQIDRIAELPHTYIVISNEIGMGVHAHEASTRKFVDLQGWANQYVASKADEAIVMISGLPLKLKN